MNDETHDRWAKFDGLEVELYGKKFYLQMGLYPNGRAGVQVFGDEGPECSLTVNLVETDIKDDEFWVKLGGEPEEFAHALDGMGLVEYAFQREGNYAELWMLRREGE